MDRRNFSVSMIAALTGSSLLSRKAVAAVLPRPPSSIAIDGIAAAPPVASPAPATSGALKVNVGTLVIAPGTSGDLSIDVGFTASVILFFSSANFYQRTMTFGPGLPQFAGQTTTGAARGICMGAYDGQRQWSQQHAVTFADGRRDGYLWKDAVYDAGADLGGGSNNIGARVVGKSIAGNTVILGVQRSPLAADGPVTMQWIAIGGCKARTDFLSVPHGDYHANAPQGVTVGGLGFQPRGVLFAPWRQTNWGTGGGTFFTATAGSSLGFASGPSLSEQAAIGSTDGYGGHVLSFAYQGCIAGPSRQDHADGPTYLARLNRFTSDGFVVDFQSADDVAPSDSVPFVALECACSAGQAALLPVAGQIVISGAAFAPKAAVFAAAPGVESNYSTPWSPLNYGTHGNENTSFGFAASVDGGVKQMGISFFDKGGYDASGNMIVVNGHEHDSTAMHDGNAIAFNDAVVKSQVRTAFQTFSQDAAASVSRFAADGLNLSQSQANGRAGKIAYLLLGDAS